MAHSLKQNQWSEQNTMPQCLAPLVKHSEPGTNKAEQCCGRGLAAAFYCGHNCCLQHASHSLKEFEKLNNMGATHRQSCAKGIASNWRRNTCSEILVERRRTVTFTIKALLLEAGQGNTVFCRMENIT